MRRARQSPEDPIRAGLFGIERLEQYAESLAAAQGVMRRSGRGRRLLQRVEHNGREGPLAGGTVDGDGGRHGQMSHL